ncbi:MAG: hypothetical protein RSA70_01255, partial [Clostridia bacterium]
MHSAFFLGANSRDGFVSLYDDLIDLKSARAVYIIKGGPGSGKSSFMKKIANIAVERGLDTERIFCSSDPDSLDGLILPELGIALVDGTSPHVVEPKYPLAVEEYVNLGAFADAFEIRLHKDEIIRTKDRYSTYFKRVYRLTSAAAATQSELLDLALGGIAPERIAKKAVGIISRELHGTGSGGVRKSRFLSAISPDGYVSLFKTVDEYENVFMIEDNFGLAMFMLQPILDAARDRNYDAVACYSPLTPERLEHVFIPELSLAFITSKKKAEYTGAYKRRIRIDAMIDPNVIRAHKRRISL